MSYSKGLRSSNPVRSSSQSGFCASLAAAAENHRVCGGLSRPKGTGESTSPPNEPILANFSLFLGEPGPLTKFQKKDRPQFVRLGVGVEALRDDVVDGI
jgi:hypothetical protein